MGKAAPGLEFLAVYVDMYLIFPIFRVLYIGSIGLRLYSVMVAAPWAAPAAAQFPSRHFWATYFYIFGIFTYMPLAAPAGRARVGRAIVGRRRP